MLTLKPSDLRAAAKTESISTTTHTKTKSIDHHPQNKLISARTRPIPIPRSKNKSLSIPTLKPSKIRSLPHKIKLISTPLLQSSQLDFHSKINIIAMPPQKNQAGFDLHTKNKYFLSPRKKQLNSNPYTEVKSNSIPL